MKILMICTEKLPVPPILGGAIQTYISGVLPHLKNVHDITVLGISDPSLPDQETIDDISYIRVPGKILKTYQGGVTSYIESHSFDLIHIFNRPRLVLPVRNVAPQAIITLSMHNDMFNKEKINSDEANAILDEVSKIVTIAGSVFFPVVINTVAGVVTIDKTYLDVAKNYGASSKDFFFKIALPGSLPVMLEGIQMGQAIALLTIVAAEMMGANSGIGYLIWTSYSAFLLEEMYVGLVLISFFGYLFSLILRGFQKKLLPWR